VNALRLAKLLALPAAVVATVLVSTSCLVENTIRCSGRIEKRCGDGFIQRCDRWGCTPQYYVSCYDVCIDEPAPAPPRDAAADARTGDAAHGVCLEDDQCPGGTRCSLGRCVDICLDDRDCTGGAVCQRGLCTDRPANPGDAAAAPPDASRSDAPADAPAGDAPNDAPVAD
jgi:hypothetical protein